MARIVAHGFVHHVTQRGNRRADIFETDADRDAYRRFLKKYCERHRLSIWVCCLMTNHVHLVAVPEKEESLSRALRDTHTVYAMYFSCPMDERHLWAAVRYTELNPVRAGLVTLQLSKRSANKRTRAVPAVRRNF